MKSCIVLSFFLASLLFAQEKPARPEPTVLQEWMDRLGAEKFPDREAAQKQLGDWSARYPRYLLENLIARYRTEKDLEIKLRLEDLIRPLAMELVFDIPPGFLGINLSEAVTDTGERVILVNAVTEGHGAAAAGIQPDDRILAIDGKTITELGGQEGFMAAIAALVPGSVTELLILRGDKRFLVSVNVGPRPPEDSQRNERHQQALRALRAWLLTLSSDGAQNPDFPIGHFPLD